MAKGHPSGGLPPLEPGATAVRFGITITASQAAQLEQFVQDPRGRSAVVRRALEEFFDRHSPAAGTSVAA